MARKPLNERIAAQKEKMARDKARLGLMEGREKKASRKLDDKRKILVGAAVLNELDRDPALKQRIMQLLHVAMVRPADRAALADLLPDGSHPPAVNTDRPPGQNDSGNAEMAAAADEFTGSHNSSGRRAAANG